MNRDGGGKPGSSRAGRQITDDEADLWHQVGRSVDKVKTKPRVPSHSDVPVPPGPHAAEPRPQPAAPAKPAVQRPQPPAAPRRAPPPEELDRRTQRQVSVGKVPIDAVLDLHGLTQEAAHSRLRGFLMSCQSNGHRMVLVITGKGGNADRDDTRFDDWPVGTSKRGVLRRSVPLWLDEPGLRAIVLSYAAAGVRHGGEGALYVRLRRLREG